MAFPRRVRRGADLEVRKASFSDEIHEGDLAALHAALEIGHDQGGLFHVCYVEFPLCAGDHKAEMEPFVARYIDCAGESGDVLELPVASGVEDRSVLQGIGKA